MWNGLNPFKIRKITKLATRKAGNKGYEQEVIKIVFRGKL
jgi:hypothetical protein